MTSQYPAKIDDSITLPVSSDNSTLVRASVLNELRAAIIAVESALGVNPASVYGTVRERLNTVETAITHVVNSGGAGIVLSGDLTGTSISQTVVGLQGYAISDAAPTDGFILTWEDLSSSWKPLAAPVGFSAGGDLAGTASSQTVISLTGNAGVVSIPSASLAFGLIPATTGTISLPGSYLINSRSFDDTGNKTILSQDTAIDADYLFLGFNGSGGGFQTPMTAIVIGATDTIYLSTGLGGTAQLTINSSSAAFTNPISIGAFPATTGDIRLPSVGTISGRNATDNTDLNMMTLLGNDDLILGSGPSYALPVGTVYINSTSGTVVSMGAATRLGIGNQITCGVPVIGESSVSSPYGIHGIGTQAMSDTDQTVAASVYCFNTIKTTGAITANKNLILPSATDDAGYTKIINNTCTGAFAIVVGDGGVGSTVTVVNGTSAVVLFDSRGATLAGAPTFPSRYELNLASGLFSTTSNIFTRTGARYIDMSIFPSTIGALTRTVAFTADIDMTSGATSVEVQLYDSTHTVAITGTDLTSTSTTNARVTSGPLTVGSSAGNIRNDVASQYELQFKMNGGGGGDAVFLTNARLVITYA
eukprot:gnl/Spiro4/23585_TR11653_c1_g2_i1.p1 gnl/Spiro4/23585_TR11653_c1_g2~~gnl/Spiro4/23585_TR11653_c1_g2_i1.p1  ORF type:complete len:591 (-),score=-101.37 gnl/Spiro4/23585_TR11653_c1_g2_i1:13-1785(-)